MIEITVSICTVTRNRSEFFPALENCILAQTFPLSELEWVILDDSPTSNPPNLEKVQDCGVRVNYRHLKKLLKLGEKRNTSHSLCEGKIIVIFDDDDYYPPTRIEHSVDALSSGATQVAGSSQLPILLLPEKDLWMAGPYGPNHAVASTLAFTQAFSRSHHCNPSSVFGEESSLLRNFSVPMTQLDPLKTICCVGHSRNTINKHSFVKRNQGKKVRKLDTPSGDAFLEKWLSLYPVT